MPIGKIEEEKAKVSVPKVGVDIDWVKAGMVNPVQDQGMCGASYAFSAIAAIESQFIIKGTRGLKLSEQEILDCSRSYGNYGCSGGWMSSVFKYIEAKGSYEDKDYPYTGK